MRSGNYPCRARFAVDLGARRIAGAVKLIAWLIVTMVVLFLSSLQWATVSEAQQFQRSETPIFGRYPGGHTGLRGGATPNEEGLGYFLFNRFHSDSSLKGADGQTIAPLQGGSYTLTNGIEYISKYEIFGMKYAFFAAIPMIHGALNRENGTNSQFQSSGLGLSDIIVVPVMLMGKSKHFDYQIGVGNFFPSGSYTAGSTLNRGSGYWEIFYSLGGVYYPSGDRKGFGISAVTRIEQNFKQPGTNIQPGDSITVDFGIDHPIAFGANHKYIFDVGITGYWQNQITRESGANAALDTTPYRVLALGPEIDWILPSYESKFVVRPQWEFATRNAAQGATFWLGFVHMFGNIF
jgi:hypothetical protein